MNFEEAMKARHSVRQYKNRSIEPEILSELQKETDACNQESGLHIQLVAEEPRAFDGFMAHYGKFSGVTNYFALIGKKDSSLEEKCGYYGERLVLKAQQLGDQGVKLVMEDALDYLGIALANTINTVSPRTVMLDGHMLETQQNQSALLRSVQRNMFRVHVGRTKFLFLPYSPDRGAEGAAAVVVRDFLLNSEL